MGNSPPPKRFDPKAEKQKFEITCIKVRSYLELQRDRRQNAANAKEKSLIQMFNSPTRSKQDEVQKASSIITDLNYVKACNIIIRFCDILKENSLRVVEAKGAAVKIENLMPYIESVCWSTKPLNLSCIAEFQSQMIYFFGADISESIQKSAKVDPDLKACFKDLLPTPLEINEYMVAFSNRIGIPLSQINACGHEFAPGGGNYGGPPSFGGAPGGGGQYMQFQMPPQPNMQFMPEQHQNFGPPMQFIEPPPQNYIPNPGFGAFQPFPQGAPPGQFMYQPPPPTNQFGGYQPPQNPGPPPPQFKQNGFEEHNGPTNNVPPTNNNSNQGGYPEFGALNIPKNNAALGGGGQVQQPAKGNSQLPNLDDFEERMRKLRENL